MNLLETLNYYNLDHSKSTLVMSNPFGTNKEMCGYISLYYSKLFEEFKNDHIKFVEIGSWYGGSLLLWEKFFTNGEIIGIDPNPQHNLYIPEAGKDIFIESNETFEDYLNKTNRIKLLQENAYNIDFIEMEFTDNSIDFLIDDGPHTRYYQSLVTDLYFKKVKPGGFIIIEDVIEDDIDFLINHYKISCPNSEIKLSFNNSPWNKKLFNIITIKK